MTERKIDDIVSAYKRLDSACEAAIKAGAMDINGPLHEAIWRAFNAMLDSLDDDGWINWYIYDSECGKRKLKASVMGGDKLRPIKNTSDLAKLIARNKNS